MTYRDLILLIYQSDIPAEIKQALYNVRATDGKSFSECFKDELCKIINTGVPYKFSENKTPGTVFERLNKESEAKALDESYNGLPSVLGVAPFLQHAHRQDLLLETALEALSTPDALNQALRERESFDLDEDDAVDKNDLLALLYSEQFESQKYLRTNHLRIYSYLKGAFGENALDNYGLSKEQFESVVLPKESEEDETLNKLREAIILEAVLAASLENRFVTDDLPYVLELNNAGVNQEEVAPLYREMQSLAMVISGDQYHFLHGKFDELMVAVRKTLKPYLETLKVVDVKPFSESELALRVQPLNAEIYHCLADYHLAETRMKGMGVLDAEVSYPFNYITKNPELFLNIDDSEEQGKKYFADANLVNWIDTRFGHLHGFSSEMQQYYDSQPLRIKLYIAGVVDNIIAEAIDELSMTEGAIQNYHSDHLTNSRLEIVAHQKDQLRKSVLQSLHPKDVEAAIVKASQDKFRIAIIDDITEMEMHRTDTEESKNCAVLIKNIRLAMTAFQGHPEEQDFLKRIAKLSASALEGDVDNAASALADMLYQQVVEEVLNVPQGNEGDCYVVDEAQLPKLDALVRAAGYSVMAVADGIGADDLIPELIKRSASLKAYDSFLDGRFAIHLQSIANNPVKPFSDAATYYTIALLSAAEFVKIKGNTQPVDGFERVSAQEFKDANLADGRKELKEFAAKQAFIPLTGELQTMREDHREFDREVRKNPEKIKAYLNNAVRVAVADLVPFDPERVLPFTILAPGYNKAGENFVVFEEHGERYVRVIHDDFQIMHNTANGAKNIGKIRRGMNAASIEAVYHLTEKDNVVGLELEYFETDSKQLKALLENRWKDEVNLARFLLSNIKQNTLATLTPDDLTYNECKLMLTEQLKVLNATNPDSSLAQHAQQVLDEVKSVKNDPDANVQDRSLNKVLLDATMLIKSPTQTAAQNFKKLAQNVQRRPWGKILAGTMLALAGVAILGLSIAACVFTFGAAAPITVLGFVLGASTLGAGLSVAGAVVGAGAAIGGAALFHSGFKRKPLRKAMEDLADDDSFKGPGRNR